MFLKRVLDIVFSIILLIILSPILALICILVRINLGSPIFFIQERVGKDNKIFKIIKFRTMKELKDKQGQDLTDEKRLTVIGKLLRATSLDELPELINVIKGDMSIVGPRPLLTQYLDLYNEEQIRRHEVYPGITGLAQVKGRNSISWSEKFKLDIEYIDNWSLLLDIKIIFLTIYKVVKRDGINQGQGITMEYFNGSN